jgi:glycosyltransferase involved in cell wall biosynthesis
MICWRFELVIMKIGVITVADSSKGLHREAELIAWAMDKSPNCTIEIIHLNTIQTDSINAKSVPSNQPTSWSTVTPSSIQDWINTVDILFLLEAINTNVLDYAIEKTKIVLVPNLEWATVKEGNDQSTLSWINLVRKYNSKGMIVIAKSTMIWKSLQSNEITSKLVNWSIPEPISAIRVPQMVNKISTILMNAGQGGWCNRRGVDVFIEAISLMPKNDLFNFILKTIKPWEEYNLGPLPENLTLIEGYISRIELEQLIASTDLIIYPSRFEGFGLSMLEALHLGIPVMCTDGWPMNEIQTINSRLLLIDSVREKQIRLAMAFEPDPKSIVENLSVLQKLNIRQEFPIELVTKGLRERQDLFVKTLHSIAGL